MGIITKTITRIPSLNNQNSMESKGYRFFFVAQMGVSKNSGTPKWMFFFYGTSLLKWMIYGDNSLFSETSKCEKRYCLHGFLMKKFKRAKHQEPQKQLARYECQAVRDFLQSASLGLKNQWVKLPSLKLTVSST